MIDQDHRIGSVRDRLLECYLGFGFGGLHFELRDISVEIAEARHMIAQVLGRELRVPDRPSRSIHLWVVTDETDEIVGKAAREVGLRGSALVVAHKELRIRRPEWRRRGFGSALLATTRDWYQECGVEFIVMEAEGDGSAFAAIRGFDFDVRSYASRPRFKGLPERELRFAAIDRLIRHRPSRTPWTVDRRRVANQSWLSWNGSKSAELNPRDRSIAFSNGFLSRSNKGKAPRRETTSCSPRLTRSRPSVRTSHSRCLTAGASDLQYSHSPAGRA